MNYGIANQSGKVTKDSIADILDLAWNSGIKTLDTAKTYGDSETVIGITLTNQNQKDWNVITKVGDTQTPLSYQLKDSAEKLTIAPDTILAHSAELFLDEKFKEEMIFAKEENLVNNIGVSLYSEDEIIKVMVSDFLPDIIQIPINILDTRLYRRGKLSMLKEKGIIIHARSVFLQGLFFLDKSSLMKQFPQVIPALEKLKIIASNVGLTIAELSLLWLISLEEVEKVIIGIDSIEQLRAHLRAIQKNIDPKIFDQALSIRFENESILNPSLWQ